MQRRTFFISLSFSLSLLLSACGGGGSDSAPGTTPVVTPSPVTPPTVPVAEDFTVSIDRTALSFAGEEGSSIAPAVVPGSGSGALPNAFYLGGLDLGSAIERITVEVVGVQARFTVYPKSSLAPGEYSGNVQLFACHDVACAEHFTGSPASVPYVVKIAKGFQVAPVSLRLQAISGARAGAEVAVQMPEGESGFKATSSAAWLTVTDVNAAGFSASARAMPPGSYYATISVSSGNRTRDLPVSYEVGGDAGTVTRIIPDAASLSLSATATASAPLRTLNVTLPSWTDEFTHTVAYRGFDTGWLGAVKSGPRSLAITASAAALSAGTYQAELQLKSDQLTAPVTVPVTLTVGAASWKVNGITSLKVRSDTRAASLAGELDIDLPNLPAQAYTARTSSGWLKLARASGATGGAPLRFSVDSAALLALENFRTHSAELTISAVDGRIAPLTLSVTLDKALPELHYVSPHTRLPAEGGVYTLRGRGLNGIVDLGTALAVEGAAPLKLTRVSDTELKVQLAGAASGDVAFSLANSLGAATGKPALRVLAQPAFDTAVVDTAGSKNGLVFDAERQVLYSVNRTLSSVMRFARAGSGWSVSSAPLPGVDAVALAPDGKSLVATASAGIVLLDPVTLERQASYPAAIGADSMNSLPRLAITNDGRAYFQGGVWGGLNYFDLVTRQFGAAGGDQRFDFYYGPWFSASGDGSRLNIVQSGSISPTPSMLYLDSSDHVPKINPAGLRFWYEAAQSLRGERFVEGTYKVWDRDFHLVGNLVLPDTGYFGRTPLLSPDGARTYVLAYPEAGLQGMDVKPRVYVFDSSTRMVTETDLPLLGQFDLPDYPTCRVSAYECDTRALGAISPDGATLFFIGDKKLVVAPVPELMGQMASQGARVQRAGGGVPVMKRVTPRR